MTDYDETHAKELLALVYRSEGVEIWWTSHNRNLALWAPVNLWEFDDGRQLVRLEINRLVGEDHE